MSLQKKIKQQRERRTRRVRNKLLSRGAPRYRVSVFRSLNHIYAQVIDDNSHNTVASFSSLKLTKEGDKSAVAKNVGLELGKLAKSKSVENVFFDRGPYRYHGRVKSLAEGLRESGLKF